MRTLFPCEDQPAFLEGHALGWFPALFPICAVAARVLLEVLF